MFTGIKTAQSVGLVLAFLRNTFLLQRCLVHELMGRSVLSDFSKRTLKFAIPALFALITSSAWSQQFPWIATGTVQRLWFGADEFLLEMNTTAGAPMVGVCGSGYFSVKNTVGGYKDFYARALAALNSGNYLNIWVTACAGDRNLVTGGSIIKR